MSTLRSLVEAALSGGNGSLEARLAGHLAPGVEAAPWAQFLADYLRKGVEASEALATVATGHSLAARVQPFLGFIAAYAAEPEDLVPDREGAWGLLDDAYVVMICIETLRELMNQPADENLTVANLIVRALLGEPVDGRLREAVQAIKQQVVVDTLADLPDLLRMFVGAAQGQTVALEIPTPTFVIPVTPAAASPGQADGSAPGPAVAASGPATALVGVWEHADVYVSSGFSGSTYTTRVLGADGRFAQQARSSASRTHSHSDGSWAGQTNAMTGAMADVGPDNRGRWSYDGALLRLDYDDGQFAVLHVTRDDNRHLTFPTNGNGIRKLWQRIG